MKLVIQKVKESSVTINNSREEKINKGLMILVGFTYNDSEEDINYIVNKVLNLRIFNDVNNKMNLSIKDINGEILLVSNFTLYSDIKNGNRPSFKNALTYDDSKILYDKLVKCFKKTKIGIKTGEFGADMLVNIVNDGPVTIIIDTKEILK